MKKKRGDNRFAVMVLAGFLIGFFIFGLNIARMWTQRTWLPQSALRILLLSDDHAGVELLMIWPGIQDPMRLAIPADVYLQAVGGYGNYTAASLLALGKTDGVGEQLLADSVAFTLASPIHQVLWYTGANPDKWKLKVGLLRQGLLGQRSLPEALTMMQLVDRVSWSTLKSVELSTASGVRQRIEVDGSVQDYIDQALLMNFLERNFFTLWPEASRVQLAVINASGKGQMATAWSRIGRLNGFDVVSVTDTPEQRQTTILVFSSKELRDSIPGKALATLYPLATVEVGDAAGYRADVVLLVGLDSWEWLNLRAGYLAR